MANSSIRIYSTNLTPARNAMVDSLETYLGTLIPIYVEDNYQYLKLDLDLSIKIAAPQNVITNQSLGNYVRIVQDGKIWYYFLLNCEWTAENTVRLSLSIDSINTFRNQFTFTDKTLIQRQHKDRFLVNNQKKLTRIVDKEAEGITITQKQVANQIITATNLDYDWYLIFKTRDDLQESNLTNPVGVYLCASSELQISGGSAASKTITANDLEEGYFYYFTDIDNVDGKFSLSLGASATYNFTIGESYTVYDTKATLRGITLSKTNNKLYAGLVYDVPVKYTKSGTTMANTTSPTTHYEQVIIPTALDTWPCRLINSITFTVGNFLRIGGNFVAYPEATANFTARFPIYAGKGQTVIAFKSVLRTDPKLMKILKLPYCPVRVSYNSTTGLYTFPSTWTYQSNGLMKLNDAAIANGFVNANVVSGTIDQMIIDLPTLDGHTAKNDIYESKLFNSAYFTYKFNYDSFNYDIELERITPSKALSLYTWRFDFKTTSTINSKFLFRFRHGFAYTTYSDYEHFMIVSRNNEEPIYNNDYVNYIRTGYNYDLKQRDQQIRQNWISTALQMAGLGGQLIASGITQPSSGSAPANSNISKRGGYWTTSSSGAYVPTPTPTGVAKAAQTSAIKGISAVSIVSNAVSFANNMISNAYYAMTSKQQIEQKKFELANQSTAVSGSDDIDLLSYYNGNRLRRLTYEPIDSDKKRLFNLFYYTGYICNYHSKPENLASRYWFNFIQCEPVFAEEGISVYNDYINDIKARFNAGVTIYHSHGGEYDWNQEYENWEMSIIAAAANA